MATRKNKKAFAVQFLAASFVIIAICEVFFLLDVLADIFQADLAAPWIDHNTLESISAVTLAFALLAIGWQIKRLLVGPTPSGSSWKITTHEPTRLL